MGCRAWRTRLLATGAGLLLLAVPARAADMDSPASSQAPRKRLDLGLYGSPYGADGRPTQPGLRFDAWVDVEAAPEPTLDEAMISWLKHFDLGEQSVYGRGYYVDPNAQPNSVNLFPLFEKVYHKLKKRK